MDTTLLIMAAGIGSRFGGGIKQLEKVDGNGHITLTGEGRAIAEPIYERHQVITAVFTALGVPEQIARQDACKVEHDLSAVTFQCMKAHYQQYLHHRGEAKD